jgi:hypothetical protein
MQSWAWSTTPGIAATSSDSAASRQSMQPATFASRSGAPTGPGTRVTGARTGRKKPASGSPSATTRTGTQSSSSASASARVCTTPPRGLVE